MQPYTMALFFTCIFEFTASGASLHFSESVFYFNENIETMERVFNDNGFVGLQVEKSSIRLVLNQICKTSQDVLDIIKYYGLEWNAALRAVHTEFTEKEQGPLGYTTVHGGGARAVVPQTGDIFCSNPFSPLEGLDILGLYALDDEDLDKYIAGTGVIEVR